MHFIFQSIEKICFHREDIFPSFTTELLRDIFCYLPNLKIFSFPEYCVDEFLESIAKFCAGIEEIDVNYSYVTSEGLKCLAKKESGKVFCSKLKKLNTCVKFRGFTRCRQDEGIIYLIKNMPSLEYIGYWKLPCLLYLMHKSNLKDLAKVEPYNIASLDLLIITYKAFFFDLGCKPVFSHMMQICLSVCPRLKHLTCLLLKEEEMELFSKLTDLEWLHLKCDKKSEINIDDVLKSNGGKLSTLTIQNLTASVSVFVENCLRLKHLCLKDNTRLLCDYELEPVLPSLETCAFVSPVMDPTTAKAVSLLLASSPKLETINLKLCDLTSSEIKEHIMKACGNRSIKKIILNECKVEREFLNAILLTCCSLNSLYLDWAYQRELSRLAESLPNNPTVYYSLDNDYDFSSMDDDSSDYDSEYY